MRLVTDRRMKRVAGFTLIELLIVVAIIAILSAIALPNFMEAQTRSKHARVISDFRSLALAVESYCVDQGAYPRRTAKMPAGSWWQTQLTTPVAYMSGPCQDVFCTDGTLANEHYQYALCLAMKSYIFVSVGPDTKDNFDDVKWMCGPRYHYPAEYDPTNGSVSAGDIWRVNKQGGPISEGGKSGM